MIERGPNKTIDILWRENLWENDEWVRFSCPLPWKDAAFFYPECRTCPPFIEAMQKAGLRSAHQIVEVLRDITFEDIGRF